MRTGADYVASLQDGRAVVLDGQIVDDVAHHPAFAGAVRSVAGLYDLAADPGRRAVHTFPSPTDGAPVHLSWLTPRTVEDLRARRGHIEAWAEATFGLMGRSPDHVASFFAGFAGNVGVFARADQRFADNVLRVHAEARDAGEYLTYTIIHPTIDRQRPPHEQREPLLYAGIADERDDGVVVRGAQMLGTGSVMSDRIFVSCILPLPPGAEDHALSVVVRNNAPGLRILTRRPYATTATSTFDYPLSSRFDETDSLVVFDDVLVPWEDVFVCRDIEATAAQFHRTAAHSLGNTQAQIRFAVKLQLFAGLARRLADDAGTVVDAKTKQRLGALAGKAAIPAAFVLAAEAGARPDDDGVMRPDPGFLYTAMTLQPTLADEIQYMLREMCGGQVIQVPSSARSFDDPQTAADLERFVCWPNATSRQRVGLLKLAWDLIGSEFGSRHFQYEMFYAGDPSVVQMRSFGAYPWERALDLVDACLADVPVPGIPSADVVAGAEELLMTTDGIRSKERA
jgi:4-hydroxyphenylacetate 3-monooxygenase